MDILHADDTGDGASEYSFSGFAFCPYCGVDVSDEADALAKRIQAHWEDFWVGYGKQHGEAELRRARRL